MKRVLDDPAPTLGVHHSAVLEVSGASVRAANAHSLQAVHSGDGEGCKFVRSRIHPSTVSACGENRRNYTPTHPVALSLIRTSGEDGGMKIATVRVDGGTRAVRIDGDEAVDLGYDDVGALLASGGAGSAGGAAGIGGVIAGGAAGAEPRRWPVADLEWERLILAPSKVLCVGLNYRGHIAEMGREFPNYPTLFMKFTDALTGANDDIAHPQEVEELDWEAELVVVIGKDVRRASTAEAEDAIAGFTVLNDVSARDWQHRTLQWLQGKNWDSSTPVGPLMVTPDEVGGVRPALRITTTVDGEVMQDSTTGDLLFDPVELVQYASTIIRLRPGDMIATGTPAGVGAGMTPPRFLKPGQTVACAIEGIGTTRNRIV